MTDILPNESSLKRLAPVLDDYAEWFVQALRRGFYSAAYRNTSMLDMPSTFKDWVRDVSDDDYLDQTVISKLESLHDELRETADRLMREGGDDGLDIRTFDNFTALYEGFVRQLHRLEYDAALADSGMDSASGLRSRKAMTAELERELERRARRGRPFSLALAKIDNYEHVKANTDEAQQRQILAKVGELIRKCIRTFDDGYRSGEAEFVMSLKHTDMTGGTSAVNRLRSFLEQEQIMIPDGHGNAFPMTMSYCVSEPLPGDTLEELMLNMRSDLDQYKEDIGDTAVEYFEQSALTRLVKTMTDQGR